MPQAAISDSALEQIPIALLKVYNRLRSEGLDYLPSEVAGAIADWLELSLEQLVDDALWHLVEGDRSYAFNRKAFEDSLDRAVRRRGNPALSTAQGGIQNQFPRYPS